MSFFRAVLMCEIPINSEGPGPSCRSLWDRDQARAHVRPFGLGYGPAPSHAPSCVMFMSTITIICALMRHVYEPVPSYAPKAKPRWGTTYLALVPRRSVDAHGNLLSRGPEANCLPNACKVSMQVTIQGNASSQRKHLYATKGGRLHLCVCNVYKPTRPHLTQS